jgi:hypothetical protein
MAEQKAELARSERERSTQIANIVVPAEIDKNVLLLKHKPWPETIRENAKGDGDATSRKMAAEANGLYEILTKQPKVTKKSLLLPEAIPPRPSSYCSSKNCPNWFAPRSKPLKTSRSTKSPSGIRVTAPPTPAFHHCQFCFGHDENRAALNDLFNMAGLNLPSYLKGAETKKWKRIRKKKNKNRKIQPRLCLPYFLFTEPNHNPMKRDLMLILVAMGVTFTVQARTDVWDGTAVAWTRGDGTQTNLPD